MDRLAQAIRALLDRAPTGAFPLPPLVAELTGSGPARRAGAEGEPMPGEGGPAVRRLKEGLRAWGAELDDGAPASVARWIRATWEGEEACRVLLKPRRTGA